MSKKWKLILILVLVILIVVIISLNLKFDLEIRMPRMPLLEPEITNITSNRFGEVYTIYNPNADKMRIEIDLCGETQEAVLIGKKSMRYSVMDGCELKVRKI